MNGQVLQVFVEAMQFVGRPTDEWHLFGSWNVLEPREMMHVRAKDDLGDRQIERESINSSEVVPVLADICATLAKENRVEALELALSGWFVTGDSYTEATLERQKDDLRRAVTDSAPGLRVYVGRSSSSLRKELEELHERIRHT